MKQLSTQLSDRELRFDGVSILPPDDLAAALLRGVHPSKLRLTYLSDEALLFNQNVSEDEQLKKAQPEPINLSFQWKLPERYLNLDLERAVAIAFEFKCPQDYTQDQYEQALDRMAAELAEIERRGMTNFIRTIIYILSVFQEKGVVWGVGRGSSCASYVLFVLGLHSVDPIRYNVPMEEFFHD